MVMLFVALVACAEPAAPAAAVDAPPAPAPVAVDANTVGTAFPPPRGAVRADADAFGASLRDLPVRAADVRVHTYDGRVVGHSARVVDLPLVPGDLQQCADSLMRVRAE